MSIRTTYPEGSGDEAVRLHQKADREDEMGSMAASDSDRDDAAKHFAKAKELRRQASELGG